VISCDWWNCAVAGYEMKGTKESRGRDTVTD